MATLSVPLVAILLGTYNGAAFLEEQLSSLGRQEHSHWMVYASDDGSSDNTCELLTSFGVSHHAQLNLRHGPAQGFTANFLSLAADPSIEADYFAYCDQDDIWKPDKLKRALTFLQNAPRPALPSMAAGSNSLI